MFAINEVIVTSVNMMFP